MIIKYTFLLLAIASSAGSTLFAQDTAVVVRRIAARTLLAAQEYGLGVTGGKITLQAEVDEANLFLEEAAKAALALPSDAAVETRAGIEALLGRIRRIELPDTVSLYADRLVSGLAKRFGVDVDVIPTVAPSLARGAEVYQNSCAGCHGISGRADGPNAAGLDPAPTNLADATALNEVSPLDYYRRLTVGVSGTAMGSYDGVLSQEDRWAAAVYASMLRLPSPKGRVPAALQAFPTTARMTDLDIILALGPESGLEGVSAVRTMQTANSRENSFGAVFAQVRQQVDSSVRLAETNLREPAQQIAFDAYLTFEQVERTVRATNPRVASEAEAAFAALRVEAAGGSPEQVAQAQADLLGILERAERVLVGKPSGTNLVVQSFVILVREGLEAILVIGAIMAFLTRTQASHRRRDIHIGVGAAVIMSLLTALALETIFFISPAHQEVLEGITLIVATGMLFYVSYWLLSKMEVGKWNRFVRARVQDAVSSGSALALASAAFLAVYREGFETVLFYKALIVSGGVGSWGPVVTGIAAGSVVLAVLYVAINRYGVRLPLKPFFGLTSAFLYYMAFVFAGKGIAELQEGGMIGTTVIGGPRVPALGIYPTAQSLSAQGLLLLLALIAVLWTFVIAPRRLRVTQVLVPEPTEKHPFESPPDAVHKGSDLERSLRRIEADLAEIRAEVERIRSRHQSKVS